MNSELKNKLLDMIADGYFNTSNLALDLVSWFSADDVVEFCNANDISLGECEEEEQDA